MSGGANQRKLFFSVGALVGMGFFGVANAAPVITGFDPSADTLNGGGISIPVGGSTTSSVLQLTNGTATANGNEGTSSYNKTAQPVTGSFTASFSYSVLAGTTPVADGFTFIVQNQSSTIGGENGGGNNGRGLPVSIANASNLLGVIGIGVENFSMNSGAGLYLNENGVTTYFSQATTNGSTTKTGNVDFSTFNSPISVTVSYDGANSLSLSATDGSSDVFSHTFTLSNTIAADLAADTSPAAGLSAGQAFVGFGGGSGGLQQTQQVTNYTFSTTSVPEPGTLGLLGLAGLGLLSRRRRA